MLCPACNALAPLDPRCPRCGALASDEGRLVDWYGPYSPYSPDVQPLTAGTKAGFAEMNACVHVAACSECEFRFTLPVPLWPL